MRRARRVRAVAGAAIAALVAIAFSLVASRECIAGPAGQRLKTGQKKCWGEDGQVVACASTTEDGALQRGLVRAYVDTGDGTVSDTQTGLEWEKLDDAGGVHDRDASYSWVAAFAKIKALNKSPCFAGHCDWRLPNVNELQSIVDYGRKRPAVPAAFDAACSAGCAIATCSCTAPSESWTSSSYALHPLAAWSVSFAYGDVVEQAKANAYRVRAVRGGS